LPSLLYRGLPKASSRLLTIAPGPLLLLQSSSPYRPEPVHLDSFSQLLFHLLIEAVSEDELQLLSQLLFMLLLASLQLILVL
jgi:hypothetical protein